MSSALAIDPKPRPAVPQELHDLIIDCVAELEDEQATLRSCHLVSVAFCRRSRSHLFKKIDIRNKPENTPSDVANRLSEAVQIIRPNVPAGAPAWLHLGIAPYIQSFGLTIFIPHGAKQGTVAALDRNGQLSSLLNSLHGTGYGIHHFALRLLSRKGERWDKFPPRVVRAFRSLFTSPNFTSLHLCDTLNFPTTLLLGTRIQKLHLSGPRLWAEEAGLPAFSHWHKQPGMSNNSLREVFATSSWSVEPKQHRGDFYASMFQNVKTLTYMVDDKETQANNDLFAVCRDTLEELGFNHTTRCIDWSHLASYFPGKYKRLHTLKLTSAISDYEHVDDLHMALSRCCQIVDIVGTESLKDITFRFPRESDYRCPLPMWEETWDINWIPLGKLIAERLKFHPNFVVRLFFEYFFLAPPSGAIEDPPGLQEAITSMIVHQTGVDPKHLDVEIHVNLL